MFNYEVNSNIKLVDIPKRSDVSPTRKYANLVDEILARNGIKATTNYSSSTFTRSETDPMETARAI